MSNLMGALVRRNLSREALYDLDASLAIQEAAQLGNPEAMAFVDEAAQRLSEAGSYREQAARMRSCAAGSSSLGSSTLAAFGSDVARLSGMEAELIEGSVIEAIRSSRTADVLGSEVAWMDDRERNLMAEKEQLWNASSAERERAFRALADRMIMDASMGADDDDAEEVEDNGLGRFRLAMNCYGEDLPLVFGDDCYERMGALFQASAERLNKRLARKKKRLVKIENKLEELEDSGKTGLRVKLLQGRVGILEKSISRLEKKLEDLGEASDDVAVAKTEKSSSSSEPMSEDDREIMELLKDDDDDDMGAVTRTSQGGGGRGGNRRSKMWSWPDKRLQRVLLRPKVSQQRKALAQRILDSRQGQEQGNYKMKPMQQQGQGQQGQRGPGQRGPGQRGGGQRGGGGGRGPMPRQGRPPFRGQRNMAGSFVLGGDERKPFVGFFLRRAEAMGVVDEDLAPSEGRLKKMGIKFNGRGRKLKAAMAARKTARGQHAATVEQNQQAYKIQRQAQAQAVRETRGQYAPGVKHARGGLLSAMMERRKAGQQAFVASRRGGSELPVAPVMATPGPVRVVSHGFTYDYDPATKVIKIVGAPQARLDAGYNLGAWVRPGQNHYDNIMAEITPLLAAQSVLVGSDDDFGLDIPWATYGEKLQVMLEHLSELMANGAPSGAIETLKSELAQAKRDTKLFGPGAPIEGDDVDDDGLDDLDDDEDGDLDMDDGGFDEDGDDSDLMGLDDSDGDLVGGLDDDELGLEDDLDDDDDDDLGLDDLDDDDLGDDDLGDDDDDFGLDDDDDDDDEDDDELAALEEELGL